MKPINPGPLGVCANKNIIGQNLISVALYFGERLFSI